MDTISQKKAAQFLRASLVPGLFTPGLGCVLAQAPWRHPKPLLELLYPKILQNCAICCLFPREGQGGADVLGMPLPGTAASEFHRSWGLTPRAAPKGRFPRLGGFFWCFFFKVPEDFSQLFCYFCACPCLFLERARNSPALPQRGRDGFTIFFFWKVLFFFFFECFFSKTFCFAAAAGRRKVEPLSLLRKEFFLPLSLSPFQGQSGKRRSVSRGSDEAGFPPDACGRSRAGEILRCLIRAVPPSQLPNSLFFSQNSTETPHTPGDPLQPWSKPPLGSAPASLQEVAAERDPPSPPF